MSARKLPRPPPPAWSSPLPAAWPTAPRMHARSSPHAARSLSSSSTRSPVLQIPARVREINGAQSVARAVCGLHRCCRRRVIGPFAASREKHPQPARTSCAGAAWRRRALPKLRARWAAARWPGRAARDQGCPARSRVAVWGWWPLVHVHQVRESCVAVAAAAGHTLQHVADHHHHPQHRPHHRPSPPRATRTLKHITTHMQKYEAFHPKSWAAAA